MTSLNAANLPSEDEEDDDYNPTGEEVSAADKASKSQSKQSIKKRRRGVITSVPELEPGNETVDPASEELADAEVPVNSAKKAKFDQLWAQLNSVKAPKQSSAITGSAAQLKPSLKSPSAMPAAKSVSLAAVCRPVASRKKADSDVDWKRQLGIKSNSDPTSNEEGIKQRAAAAAAAAAQASLLKGTAKKAIVTETRRFAGKDIEYTRAANQHDEKVQKAKAIQQGGLDNLLSSLEQARKVNVLDKSRMDWGQFKSANTKVEEELEGYKKSGDKYLDKVDFLQRAEVRQYEQERDQRLSHDMRSRGRL